MNKVIFSITIFIMFVGASGTFANAQEIPSWVKFNAGYWADDSIDDSTFINALQFLIKEQIVVIPQTEISEKQSDHIPSWVKFNAGYWAQGAITDLDFINSMQYLIANGIIVIDHTTIDNITAITITGTISYWQPIDGPSYAITPKEDLSVPTDEGKIYLYGDVLDKSLDGKQVKITGKIVENYQEYQISKYGATTGGDPTTSVIFVSEVNVIPSYIMPASICAFDPENPDAECDDTPDLKP